MGRGVIAIEDKVGATVNVEVPETEPLPGLKEAVMVVVPKPTPVANPEDDMVAFATFDELQEVTAFVISADVLSE